MADQHEFVHKSPSEATQEGRLQIHELTWHSKIAGCADCRDLSRTPRKPVKFILDNLLLLSVALTSGGLLFVARHQGRDPPPA